MSAVRLAGATRKAFSQIRVIHFLLGGSTEKYNKTVERVCFSRIMLKKKRTASGFFVVVVAAVAWHLASALSFASSCLGSFLCTTPHSQNAERNHLQKCPCNPKIIILARQLDRSHLKLWKFHSYILPTSNRRRFQPLLKFQRIP